MFLNVFHVPTYLQGPIYQGLASSATGYSGLIVELSALMENVFILNNNHNLHSHKMKTDGLLFT